MSNQNKPLENQNNSTNTPKKYDAGDMRGGPTCLNN